MKFALRPHQYAATQDAMAILAAGDRATVVMPCGTGKTLVGASMAEALGGQITVVLVPSLALVKQIIEGWRAAAAIPKARFVAVCSDSTVADEDDIDASEVGTEVLMQAEQIEALLVAGQADQAPVVIVTTYASAAIAGDALRSVGLRASFALYDEAHRTATGGPSVFGSTLHEHVLPAEKRLFLTATPRTSSPDEYGADVLSMDNQAMYGPIAHALSIQDAIARGLIVDYKILISVIATSELDPTTLSRDNVQEQASAIAIGKAMREYGLSKGILFHRRVADAASFAASAYVSHETQAQVSFVSGEMTSAERSRRMSLFEDAPVSLVSNAKCLTEGVDMPAVDLIGFMSPKKSLIDIVQATGRALRTSPGKTCGYVLLPLLVDLSGGETIAEALKRSDMSELASVLSELREMEMPVARLRHQHRGVATPADVERALRYIGDRVELLAAPELVSGIREAIQVMTMRSLHTPWEERFIAVKAYMETHGHLQFAYGSVENKDGTGKFVSNCRTMKRNGTLSKRNIQLLNEIGFPWTLEDNEWLRDLAASALDPWKRSTLEWEDDQRRAYAEKTLSPGRMAKLVDRGFDFSLTVSKLLPPPAPRTPALLVDKTVDQAVRNMLQEDPPDGASRWTIQSMMIAMGLPRATISPILQKVKEERKLRRTALSTDDPRHVDLDGRPYPLSPAYFLSCVSQLRAAASNAPAVGDGHWTVRTLSKETCWTMTAITGLLWYGFGLEGYKHDDPLPGIPEPLQPEEVAEIFGAAQPQYERQR